MVKLDSQISKYGIFGDFGADNTSIEFDGGGMPVPHLRYATQNNWFVCRGGPPHELGDGSIRQVCRWITESPYFAGEIFSWGDEAISDLAASRSDVKTASYWRSINMNHHMTMAVRDLSTLNKTKIAERTMRRTSLQQALFVE
jgi:hypothetical protein